MVTFFDYFQVICLALFLFLVIGISIYIRKTEKITAVRLTLKDKGLQGFLEISLFVIVNICIVEVLLYALHTDFHLFPAPLDMPLVRTLSSRITGVLLLTGGYAIYISALFSLGISWRLGIDEKKPGRLVTTGIYAITRNPMYIFFNLFFLGTFLINGTLIFLIFTIFAAINLHYQILGEEKFLEEVHGQPYRDYRSVTGRYLPWRRVRAFATRSPLLFNHPQE